MSLHIFIKWIILCEHVADSQKYVSKMDTTEPWYGTRFCILNFCHSWLLNSAVLTLGLWDTKTVFTTASIHIVMSLTSSLQVLLLFHPWTSNLQSCLSCLCSPQPPSTLPSPSISLFFVIRPASLNLLPFWVGSTSGFYLRGTILLFSPCIGTY